MRHKMLYTIRYCCKYAQSLQRIIICQFSCRIRENWKYFSEVCRQSCSWFQLLYTIMTLYGYQLAVYFFTCALVGQIQRRRYSTYYWYFYGFVLLVLFTSRIQFFKMSGLWWTLCIAWWVKCNKISLAFIKYIFTWTFSLLFFFSFQIQVCAFITGFLSIKLISRKNTLIGSVAFKKLKLHPRNVAPQSMLQNHSESKNNTSNEIINAVESSVYVTGEVSSTEIKSHSAMQVFYIDFYF